MIRSRVRWLTLLVALAGVGACVATMWLFWPPLYLTSDDVTIRLGIEGLTAPGQPPTGFVLITHAALAWALVAMGYVLPSVPLWDVLLTTTFICAAATFVAVAWAMAGSWTGRFAAIAAVLTAMTPMLAGLQFTISATLAGAAGLMLAEIEWASLERRRTMLAFAGLQLLAGVLIRPGAAAAGAIATGLFVIPFVLLHPQRRGGDLARHVATTAAAVAVAALAILADSAIYRAAGDGWSDYRRYQSMSRLLEWEEDASAQEVTVARAAAGWTANDWRMLKAFWSIDPDVHGVDRVLRAYEQRPSLFGLAESLPSPSGFREALSIGTVEGVVVSSVTVLIVAAAFVAAFANAPATLAFAMSTTAFLVFCVTITGLFKELPFRLLAPLQASLLAVVVIGVTLMPRRVTPVVSLIALSLTLTLFAREVQSVVTVLRANELHTTQVRAEVDALRSLEPSLLVLHSDTFPAEHWWRPFRNAPVNLPAIRLGANNQNPLVQRFLVDAGRQPLFPAVCEDASILVVSAPGRLDFLTTYMQEHFETHVRWEEAWAGSFSAWRCIVMP